MALMQAATKKLIKPDANDPKIKARIGILHVDAGDSADLFNLFKSNQGSGKSHIEAHFHIPKVGPIIQYRDTAYQADANRDANDFALSFESQGLGEGEWNAHQLDQIKQAMLWCHTHHGIPLRKVTTWDDPVGGWGYHTLFGAPSHWTPVAKSCPGPDRKVQFEKILVPWLNRQGMVLNEGGKVTDKMNDVEAFKTGVLALAKKHPIPKDRVHAHAQQVAVVNICKEAPLR